MERKAVYVETSIVSYLTARPTSDLLAAAWQKATLDWWDTQRVRFFLYTSIVVREEAGRGDPEAASRRLASLSDIPLLAITDEVVALSKALIAPGALPAKAIGDSLHIAAAAVHAMDYLLTWNCRHIDNAEMKPVVRTVCTAHGYVSPEICTPQELMEQKTMTDPIIEELWRIKDGIAREYGGSVDAFVAYLKAQESAAGQQVVDLRARRIAEQRHAPDAQKDACR